MDFGTILKNLRLAKGYSQPLVAFAVGLEQSSYSRIENGISDPRASTLLKIAEFYEVDVASLYPAPKR
jgi:transcriptional regulator with XRE-family HTH domain